VSAAERRSPCTVGVDLGLVADYTAVVVVERGAAADGPGVVSGDAALRREPTYAVRHLERPPLGTSYPDIVDGVRDLMAKLPTGSALVVDATGVGRPVVDLLRQARLTPVPVVVHGGAETTVDANGFRRVPKRELVSRARVLLERGRLKLAAALPLVPTLVEELRSYRLKISDAGHEGYEAWREGQHDDLVFSLCLAVWCAELSWRGEEWRRLHPAAGTPYRVSLGSSPARGDREHADRARAYRPPGVNPFAPRDAAAPTRPPR